MAEPTYEVAWDPWYSESPSAGMVAWWRFDEGTGATAADETGDNDGTITDGAWEAGYLPGFALTFNGVSTLVNCGSDASIDDLPLADFTFSFLFRPDALVDWRPIVSKNTFSICVMANGRLRVRADFAVANALYYTSPGDLVVGEWAMWDVTFLVATKTWRICKNGVECTYSGTTAGNGAYTTDAGDDLIWGNVGAGFTAMAVDDAQIVTSALSVADCMEKWNLIKHVTSDVKLVTIEYGKNSKLPFDLVKAQTGRCSLIVNNFSSKWCPEFTTSPLYPYVKPNKPFRIRATWLGTVYDLFEGKLTSDLPRPFVDEQMATLSLLDGMDYLARAKVNIPLQEAQLSGVIKGALLDSAGWHAAKRVIDTGVDTFDLYYTQDDPYCLDSLRELDDAELDFTYVDRSGNLAAEDRHHRLAAPHIVSQGTFTTVLDLTGMDYDYGIESVRNEIACPVTPHVLQASANIWELVDVNASYSPADVPYLGAGETKTFWAKFSNFAKNVSNPLTRFTGLPQQATDEVRANSAANNSGADHSGAGDLGVAVVVFSDGAMISLINLTAATIYITLLRIWGQLYSDENKTTIKKSDTTSQDRYDIRTMDIAGGEFRASAEVALQLVLYILSIRKDPQPEIDNVQLIGDTNVHLTQVLARTVSDRITIQSTELGINGDYFINKVKLDIPIGGVNPVATWTVAKADSEEYWTLGVSTLGESTRLCY